MSALPSPRILLSHPRMFIDVQHGLSNRLRAWASASAIAARTGHVPVLIWCPDAHCEARVGALLDYEGPLIETPQEAACARAASAQVYNYMEIEEGAQFDAPVMPRAGDVYIRSAYTLVSPHHDAAHAARLLRALRPAAPVRALVRAVRRPNAVAAHVRAAGNPGQTLAPYDGPENWPAHRHAELEAWRAKSQPERFIDRLEALVAQGRAQSIFLAADRAETYDLFTRTFGDRLVWLERDLYDRSARQIQYALADLILLGAADRLLASTWSSFSDLAGWLIRPGAQVEQSGRDF